jgi:hypothetical protein
MSRGNRSSAALIEKRRTRLLEIKQQGKTTIEAEEILTAEGFPADRVTLWRDLKGMMIKLEANNGETYLQLKQEQNTILRRMEELLITEQVDPEVAREWRAIRKSISANVNVEQQVIPIEQQLEYLNAFAGLYEDERLEELDRVKARKRTCRVVMEAHPFRKQLEVGS